MIDEMPCGYGTVRTTGVRIRNQVSCRACAEVKAALEVSRRAAQRSQPLHTLSILIVKFRSILNAPPSLLVFSGAYGNALAESESELQCSRGGWEPLEVLRSTGESYRSVWEVCVWLPDRITFCWFKTWSVAGLLLVVAAVSALDGWTWNCTWLLEVMFGVQ